MPEDISALRKRYLQTYLKKRMAEKQIKEKPLSEASGLARNTVARATKGIGEPHDLTIKKLVNVLDGNHHQDDDDLHKIEPDFSMFDAFIAECEATGSATQTAHEPDSSSDAGDAHAGDSPTGETINASQPLTDLEKAQWAEKVLGTPRTVPISTIYRCAQKLSEGKSKWTKGRKPEDIAEAVRILTDDRYRNIPQTAFEQRSDDILGHFLLGEWDEAFKIIKDTK